LSDAYKAAYNPETGAIDNTKLMRGLAERGAGHLIPDVQTKMLATQEKQGAIKKTAVETTGLEFKQRIDKATKAIGDIAALNNPEEAMASIDQHLANGDIDKQKADMLKGQLSQAPSFGAWQKGMLVNILDAKERLTQTSPKPMQVTRADGSIIFLDQNPNSPTFQKEIMPAQASGMTPYQIEQNKIAKQNAEIAAGQLGVSQGRLGVERQRVGLEGQRVNIARQESERKMQGLEALPPKEIQKREAVFPQATAAVKGFENKSTSFVNDLIALRDDPGLEQITGAIYGRTPSVSREGSRAQALYDKIVAKGGFQALQDMRDASKTGGALGNISNQEGKQLTASFAAIDRRQDAKDVKAAIDQAIADIEGSKVRMREAYDSTYNYKFGAPAANVVTNPKFPGFSVGKP
jgi:hypothetical protein